MATLAKKPDEDADIAPLAVVSASPEDVSAATRVVTVLEQLGYTCWRPGSTAVLSKAEEIEALEALRKADLVVVILSRSGNRSDRVWRHTKIGVELGRTVRIGLFGDFEPSPEFAYYIYSEGFEALDDEPSDEDLNRWLEDVGTLAPQPLAHGSEFGTRSLTPPSPTAIANHPRTPGCLEPGTLHEVPSVYVSYAWGEDSSDDGRRREDVVDRLCEVIRLSGREIGRDKERLRAGDSIERFAGEMSRARRIVAVISEKSLQSEFCMAHELFRAYRRCDFQTVEFQEKVIALVMDDARPLLENHLARVRLAEQWKDRLDLLQTGLAGVDPGGLSRNVWAFVELVREMVPRLPNMLTAMTDIVMARGFDDIVADGFQQVLDRLPAA